MFSRSTNPAHPAWQWHRLWYRLLVQNVRRLPFFFCKRDFRRKPRMHPAQSLLALGTLTLGLLAMVPVRMMVLLSR